MSAPTNTELARKIDQGFKVVNNRIDETNKRINPIHDFMVGQQAIAQNKQNAPNTKEQQMWDIIKWLILVIAAFAGVKLV